MKIGLIGLGDIAQKAYLPTVCTMPNLDIHLATRNQETLMRVGQQYRIDNQCLHRTAHELIQAGIEIAFVHAATEAHEELVQSFLEAGIHTFVDKPVCSHYEQTQGLFQMAESNGLLLGVGFNRRYAPLYRQMCSIENRDVIVLQKHRRGLPGDVRAVVMDDFIHVVDSLRFLLPGDVDGVRVRSKAQDKLLEYVMVEMSSGSSTAVGIMHRNAGFTEERLEVIAAGESWVIENLTEAEHLQQRAMKNPTDNWTSTLARRGFPQMISEFINLVQSVQTRSRLDGGEQSESGKNGSEHAETSFDYHKHIEDMLETHRICEDIVRQIES